MRRIDRIRIQEKGYKQSSEHRKKISLSHLGKVTWIKGLTKETNKSVKKIGEKNRISLIGLFKGKNSPNWKGGITPLTQEILNLIKYKQWRKIIFKRDNYTCQNKECNQYSGNLEVDHRIPKSYILKKNNVRTINEALNCKELWDTNNGRTLCHECHTKTDTYKSKAMTYRSD